MFLEPSILIMHIHNTLRTPMNYKKDHNIHIYVTKQLVLFIVDYKSNKIQSLNLKKKLIG